MAYNKGLINNPGENNCFLNSAVQVSKKYLLAEIFNGSLVVTGKNRGRFLPHKSKLINAHAGKLNVTFLVCACKL